MNDEILSIFKGFEVDGVTIPVALMKYEGHGNPYVVFAREDDADSYSADDSLQCWVTYYDFNIYSKKNYLAIAEAVRDRLEAAGWTWQPSRSNFDNFEQDTGYYHVTLNFAKERS